MMTGQKRRQVFGPAERFSLALTINLFLFVSLPIHFAAQTPESHDKSPLLPSTKVERQIAGGEVHAYSLTLTAGEFVRLVAEGRTSDLVLSLQNSQGQTLLTIDGIVGFSSQRRLPFVAAQSGNYQLNVRPSRKDAAPASYQLNVDAWRQAEPKDESAVAAERTFREGESLNRKGGAEALRHAIETYDASLPLWRAAGERLPEAITFLKTGLAYHNLSRFKEAIERYNLALAIFNELGEEPGVAQTLTNLGWSHSGLGQFQKATDFYNRSLEIRRRLNEPRGRAQTLNLVADALQSMGEQQQAIDRYLEALPLAQAAGDQAIEAFTLNGLGWLYTEMGEYRKSLDCIERALALWRKVGNRYGEAQALNIRGTIYPGGSLLAPDQALESFEQAKQIWTEVGNRYGEAQVLNNLGVMYSSFADHDRARDSYLQALAIWEAIGNRNEQAKTLGNLGLTESRLGRAEAALDYLQQSLARQTASGNRKGETIPLHNIGSVLGRMGKFEQAVEYQQRALTLAQETGQREVEANILNDLGMNYEKLGDDKRAFDYYQRTLSMPVVGIFGLARFELRRGNLAEARRYVERIITQIEKRRARISDQQMRVTYTARRRDFYELHADILMRMYDRAIASSQPSDQYLAAALEASERAHARGLLETLSEARADIRQGADPALLADERSVQDRLNARETRRVELLNSKGQEKRLAAIEKEIQELERELQRARTRIRARSPGYAALTQPAPLKLSEIQKLLDGETVLLEYLLGEERSFLWLVTPTAIKGYTLPGRAEIEPHVRRLYEYLTQPETSNAIVGYDRVAATLSRILLGQVTAQLGRKRLLIVSDGALQYLPFAALPLPKDEEKRMKDQGKGKHPVLHPSSFIPHPLLIDHEIINLPSASVLAVMRRELTHRKPAPKALAVLADPVFGNSDPRVAANGATTVQLAKGTSPPKFDSDIKRSLRDAGQTDFVRLRFSRQEAEAISDFLPAKERFKALDFTASRATAESPELSQYRLLHFATHGLLNSLHPELSGLVFSLVDERGQAQDGFLRLHQIYNLKLNADLVVLSACQTALGKEIQGEGLIGLTRGFMYAGAPRVVASLWRVDDRATAELMRRFYRGMLIQGLRPAAALRAAQVSMLKEKGWAAPQYWAAFTLQGEWR